MRFLKKYLRKIYHFISFLTLFFLFLLPVHAVQGNPNLNGIDFYTPTAATFLDNTNGNLTQLSTGWSNEGKFFYSTGILSGGSTSGMNLNFTSLQPVVVGYSYILSVVVGTEQEVDLRPSDNIICIAENLANNITRWNNGWCVSPFYKDSYGGINFNIENSNYPSTINYTVLYYGFTSNLTAKSIQVVFNSVSRVSGQIAFGGYRLELISDNTSLSQAQIGQVIQNSGLATSNSISDVQRSISQIQSDISTSSNNIINNNNQNTQSIIDSSGSNTQSIIDNNNQNTQQEIESQKSCRNVKYNINLSSSGNTKNRYLNTSGSLIPTADSFDVSDYYHISSKSSIFAQSSNSLNAAAFCFYDENKTLISCESWNRRQSITITPPNNTDYFRTTVTSGSVTVTGSYCGNGNQVITDSIDDLNDNITDSSVDSSDNTINNLKTQLPTNSVISDLLLLPVRFLQNFINALGSSCSSFSLGSLYGTELFMPCINIENYLGSGIWTTIDLIISGLFVYSLRKKFIEIYENLTNLKNGGNEVD